MKNDIDRAIKVLTSAIKDDMDSADALRYTQAALNLAHLKLNIVQIDKDELVPT